MYELISKLIFGLQRMREELNKKGEVKKPKDKKRYRRPKRYF